MVWTNSPPGAARPGGDTARPVTARRPTETGHDNPGQNAARTPESWRRARRPVGSAPATAGSYTRSA